MFYKKLILVSNMTFYFQNHSNFCLTKQKKKFMWHFVDPPTPRVSRIIWMAPEDKILFYLIHQCILGKRVYWRRSLWLKCVMSWIRKNWLDYGCLPHPMNNKKELSWLRKQSYKVEVLNVWYLASWPWYYTQFDDPYIITIVLQHRFWRPESKCPWHINGSRPTCC